MAIVGALGNIVFSVSSTQVKTFDDMRWESSVQYAAHNRHLKEPLLEFVGTDTDRITFTMYLSAFLGVCPLKEIENLRTAMDSGRIMRLVIGRKPYGKSRWVIQRLQKPLKRFDDKGALLEASVNVTLLAYGER
jgi:hypothetical protein